MRGLDTNVLVRYLAQDDAVQAKAVDELVKRAPLYYHTITVRAFEIELRTPSTPGG